MQRCRNSITKPVQTCLQYSDGVRCLRNAFFCIFECSCSSVLHRILLKLHILTHLIESYPTMHSLSSCIEIIMSVPLAAHTTLTMYACRKMSFCHFKGSHSSVLHCILLKLHILTHLIESFPMVYGLWSCIEIEMSIPPGAHA